MATMNNNEECIEALMKMPNIDVNAKCDSLGDTVLHLNIKKGHIDRLKRLLSRRSTDVNVQNYNGDTPLHVAIEKKDVESVVALLSHDDINTNITNRAENKPVTYPTIPVNKYSKVIVCGDHRQKITEVSM